MREFVIYNWSVEEKVCFVCFIYNEFFKNWYKGYVYKIVYNCKYYKIKVIF